MSHYHPCDDERCEPFGVHVDPDAASAWQAAIRVVESSTAESTNPTSRRGLDAYRRGLLAGLRIAAKRAGVPVPASFGEPFGEDDSGQSEPPTATCAHCGGPQRGSAAVGDNPLCHPNEGLDCYREVTVYGHPMPCETCVPCAQAVRQAAAAGGIAALADHPHADPDDGRTECSTCGKWVFQITHSCKGVPVTVAAWKRLEERQQDGADVTRPTLVWVCGAAHADRQCASRNPHRSRVCGWRMAEHQREQL